MINFLLYTAVVLIWGSSWIMINYQTGVVPVEASIAYRLGISAFILFVWAVVKKQSLRFSLQNHLFMALQGALIFSTNFFLFYMASDYISTGLISVVCSTASIMTMVFNSLRLQRLPSIRLLAGAVLGVIGISIIFWPELFAFSFDSGAGLGLLLSIGGTISFSLGSIVSARNHDAGLSSYSSIAWGMVYGMLVLTLYLNLRGERFDFDPAFPYVGSLIYLAVIGTVIGFVSYFTLLGRIEAERAAYVTVLFPVVALSLSTLFEGYQWTVAVFLGVTLTLLGNVFVLMQPRKI